MKHLLVIFICLFSINSLSAKERVIDLPTFSACNTQTIEIRKIVLSDTATVLYVDAFYPHNMWIKIISKTYLKDTENKKYTIRSSEGIPLDEEFYMPESGTVSFQLLFPPIPNSLKEISFIEGEEPGAFQIWGIRLDGKPFSSSMADKKISAEKATLEIPKINPGIAVLSGKLEGYTSEMKMDNVIGIHNVFTKVFERIPVDIEPDGTFKVEIPMNYTGKVAMMAPYMDNPIYLRPGGTTYININLPEIFRSRSKLHNDSPSVGKKYIFSGEMAALNNEIANHTLKGLPIYVDSREEHMKEMTDIAPMNGDQFKTYFLQKYKTAIKELDKYPDISEAYKELLILDAKMDIVQTLMNGRGRLEYAYKIVNGLDRDAEIPEEVKPIFTDDYYNFIPELIPNTGILLYYNYAGEMASFLSHMGKPDSYYANTPTITELMGTDKGMLFDLIAAKEISNSISEFVPINDEQLAKAAAISPAIGEILTAENNKLKAKIEANKKKTGYTVSPVDITSIPHEDVFIAMTQPFRGKVVFVDFWATWCGPCIQAFKTSEEVKKEMEEKGVIFLYVAGENSPKGTWENMIPDIKGNHYRITNAQWEHIWSFFNMSGVPTYFIIGKDGTIVDKKAGFPGSEWMRKKLTEELEKEI